MIIVPFQAEHVEQITVQSSQICEINWFGSPEYIKSLESGIAYTGIVDGVVMACAGLMQIWPGRYYAWALLTDQMSPHHMIAITRAVRRGLHLIPNARVEAIVQSDFEMGHRWMGLLGFTRETPEPMRRYYPDGQDAVLYARV